MKKFLAKILESIDFAVFIYVLTGGLLTIAIVELWVGHYHHAVNNILYTIVSFGCASLIKRNRAWRKVCMIQQGLIDLISKRDKKAEGPYLKQEFEDDLSDIVQDFIERGDFDPNEANYIDFGMVTGNGDYSVELTIELLKPTCATADSTDDEEPKTE